MSQLILDRPRTAVAVVVPRPQPDGSAPLVFRPESEVGLALGAARADVVRLGFSARVPSLVAMRRLVEAVEDEIAAVGRDRSSVRIVLDVEVVLTADDAAARRKRAQLDHLDALAGIPWVPSGTRVIAAPAGVVSAAVDLGEQVGADEVLLVPLTGSADIERLRLLVIDSLSVA